MFDLIIKGGRVVDGTGRAAFDADVAIEKGAIAAIGTLGADARSRSSMRAVASSRRDSSTRTRISTCSCCGTAPRVRRSSTA